MEGGCRDERCCIDDDQEAWGSLGRGQTSVMGGDFFSDRMTPTTPNLATSSIGAEPSAVTVYQYGTMDDVDSGCIGWDCTVWRCRCTFLCRALDCTVACVAGMTNKLRGRRNGGLVITRQKFQRGSSIIAHFGRCARCETRNCSPAATTCGSTGSACS
jgi:hypothetical protein